MNRTVKPLLSDYELSQIPEHLRDRVKTAVAAYHPAVVMHRHLEGKVVCTGLRPTPTGVMKTCHHNDPRGEIRGWVEDWRAADKRIKELEALLAKEGWRPIADAPKDATPVDLWVPGHKERLTDMRRKSLGKNNVFYEAIGAGYSCVRNATHFRLVPVAPEMA